MQQWQSEKRSFPNFFSAPILIAKIIWKFPWVLIVFGCIFFDMDSFMLLTKQFKNILWYPPLPASLLKITPPPLSKWGGFWFGKKRVTTPLQLTAGIKISYVWPFLEKNVLFWIVFTWHFSSAFKGSLPKRD